MQRKRPNEKTGLLRRHHSAAVYCRELGLSATTADQGTSATSAPALTLTGHAGPWATGLSYHPHQQRKSTMQTFPSIMLFFTTISPIFWKSASHVPVS